MSVLIAIELTGEKPSNASLELLALARTLANGNPVVALSLGADVGLTETLIEIGRAHV